MSIKVQHAAPSLMTRLPKMNGVMTGLRERGRHLGSLSPGFNKYKINIIIQKLNLYLKKSELTCILKQVLPSIQTKKQNSSITNLNKQETNRSSCFENLIWYTDILCISTKKKSTTYKKKKKLCSSIFCDILLLNGGNDYGSSKCNRAQVNESNRYCWLPVQWWERFTTLLTG